ncbi:MAG: hypothetical protein HOE48_19020 [Candidatus Latescibacteria bacterium]|jgi:hypothetical protein|nr:hypothetical protein [Candidatus Latescibacterota bacterium]MBT4140018.1 hypothetical protein [Candidatus Latescibacterota bacterium]
MDPNALTICIHRASHYLETHGPPWTLAMARFMTNQGDRNDVLTALAKYQNDDGGWWGIGTLKAPISTISNTIKILALWYRYQQAHKG